MNEHDSERIAGLLAADGMEPTDELDSADVIVLNTCCIRENADNKLYGHLGAPQGAEAVEAGSPDRGWRVPRPEGPRARRAARRPRRRGVRHPQPRARGRPARSRPARGADRRDPRGARGVPVGTPGTARQPALGVGHHPARLRQLVHVLHRADRPRRRSEPADGRHRARGRGARGRRRARDHAARPERQLVRPRPRRRTVPAAVRRPAASARRGRRPGSDPLHLAAPEGPAARDDRGDGGVHVGMRAPALATAGRERPHAWRACTAATPPRATSPGSPPRATRSRTSPSPPISSSASPARPTPTSSARSRWSTPLRTTLPTPSCSPRGRVRPRPT